MTILHFMVGFVPDIRQDSVIFTGNILSPLALSLFGSLHSYQKKGFTQFHLRFGGDDNNNRRAGPLSVQSMRMNEHKYDMVGAANFLE